MFGDDDDMASRTGAEHVYIAWTQATSHVESTIGETVTIFVVVQRNAA
jgi:hypothetical protein